VFCITDRLQSRVLEMGLFVFGIFNAVAPYASFKAIDIVFVAWMFAETGSSVEVTIRLVG